MSRRIKNIIFLAGLFAALGSSPAKAVSSPTLSFAGGVESSLAGVSGIFNPTWVSGFSSEGYDLSHMQLGGKLKLDGIANLTYSFVGKEAAYDNLFRSGSNFLSGNEELGSLFSFNPSHDGKLEFAFQSNSAGEWFKNGSKNIGLILSADRQSALILFNDKGVDKDFDDMVMRVTVSAVPEPETLPLFMAGLGLVGIILRRRKSAL